MKAWRPHGIGEDEALFADALGALSTDRIDGFAEDVDRCGALPERLLSVLADHDLFALAMPESQEGGVTSLETTMLAAQRVGAAVAEAGMLIADASAVGVAYSFDPNLNIAYDPRGWPMVAIADLFASGEVGPHDVARVEMPPSARQLLVLSGDEAFIVALPSEGVDVGKRCPRPGLRGSDLRMITISTSARDAAVPVSSPGLVAGVRHAQLLGRAATMMGIGQAALAGACEYIDERTQFGRRLSEFPALRVMLSGLQTHLDGALECLYAIARRPDVFDDGLRPAVLRAVATVAEATLVATVDAIQLHGGYGYSTDYDVERRFRDALSIRASLGGVRPRLTAAADDLLLHG